MDDKADDLYDISNNCKPLEQFIFCMEIDSHYHCSLQPHS